MSETKFSPPEAQLDAKNKEALEKLNSNETIHYITSIAREINRNISPEDVEEVIQNVMLKANQALKQGKFRHEADLNTWIYRITHNFIISTLRTETRNRKNGLVDKIPQNIEASSTDPSPKDSAQQSEIIEKIMKELPEKQQEFLKLLLQGFTHQEIGERLGISRQGSASKLHHLKNKYGDAIKRILKP